MVKAILFDLDGTLLDTVGDIHRHLNEALCAHGYAEISLEETRRFIGDGARKLVERALPKDAKFSEELFSDFAQRYAESDNRLTKPYAGEREALKKFLDRGVRLGIVTNKPQAATVRCVEQFFSDIPFDFVQGDSGTFPCKPDPTLARYAALSMRVPVGECAFVGDGETDIRTARNAGMFSVAVLWGYRSREQLEGAGARTFAADFQELEKILFPEKNSTSNG